MRFKPVRLSCQRIDPQDLKGAFVAEPVREEPDREVKEDKPKNGWWMWIIPLLLLIGAWMLYRWLSMRNTNNGEVVIAITSSSSRLLDSAGMSSLTKASLEVDSLQMLPSVPGKSWVSATNGSQTIDLLSLRNATATGDSSQKPIVLGKISVPAQQYRKLKFHMGKAVAETADGAKLVFTPGNNVEFETAINVGVKKDSVTVIIIDFALDESMRDATDETGRQVKVFAPVIRYQVLGDSQVTTANKRLVFQKPGVLQDKGTVGMDVNGLVARGMGIPQGSSIAVNKGKIVVAGPTPGPQSSPSVGPSPQVAPSKKVSPSTYQGPPQGQQVQQGQYPPLFPPLSQTFERDASADSYPDLSDVLLPKRVPAFIDGRYNREYQ